MEIIFFILSGLKDILKKLPTQWFLSLRAFILGIFRLVKEYCKRKKLPHSETNATETACGTIRHPSLLRADPMIYSQRYLKSLGLAVTWNNPDILLLKDGVIVSENDLLPDTDYTIRARIWNNSYEAPVAGLPVKFLYRSFGSGTQTHFIGTRSINVGVKGGVQHPAFADQAWRTPNTPGHYCLRVEFDWFDDINPANNMGQNNIRVEEPQSPAEFVFKLRNDRNKTHIFRLTTDSYEIPQRPECGSKVSRDSSMDRWDQIKKEHDPANFPVPPSWEVKLVPQRIQLSPNEAVDVHAMITPPENFVGQKPINVNAILDNGELAGGVTLYVKKS